MFGVSVWFQFPFGFDDNSWLWFGCNEKVLREHFTELFSSLVCYDIPKLIALKLGITVFFVSTNKGMYSFCIPSHFMFLVFVVIVQTLILCKTLLSSGTDFNITQGGHVCRCIAVFCFEALMATL